MRKPVSLSVMVLLVALGAGCSPRATQPGAGGGTAGGTTATPGLPVLTDASFKSGEAFDALPPGDMLMTVDAGTLINQIIPTALVASPDQKAKFDQGLAEMQEKSGIDPKQLKLVALSISNMTGGKPNVAAVMTGSFDTAKLNDSLKAKDEKTGAVPTTEDYNGKTIYVRKDEKGEEFVASVLDEGTVIFGSSPAVAHQIIDAHAGKADNARKDAALFDAFKATDGAGVLRFAAKFPKDRISPEDAAKDPTAKSFAAVNYLTGSLTGTSGLGVHLTAKTGSPTDAQPLHDNLEKMLAMGKQYMSANPQMKGFATILNATTLSVNGSDVDLAMNIPPDQLVALAEDFKKMAPGLGGMAGGVEAPTSGGSNDDDQ